MVTIDGGEYGGEYVGEHGGGGEYGGEYDVGSSCLYLSHPSRPGPAVNI